MNGRSLTMQTAAAMTGLMLSVLAAHAGRRHHAHSLPLAALPMAAVPSAPRAAALVVLRAAHTAPPATYVSSRSSRGPPRA